MNFVALLQSRSQSEFTAGPLVMHVNSLLCADVPVIEVYDEVMLSISVPQVLCIHYDFIMFNFVICVCIYV